MDQKKHLLKSLDDEEAYGSNRSYAKQWLNTMDEISFIVIRI